MHTIRTSALTLISIVASLVLLLMPDSYQHNLDLHAPVPSLQTPLTQLKHEDSLQLEPEPNVLVEPLQATTAIDKPQLSQADNGPFALYPELEQIIQLENLQPQIALSQLQTFLYDADPVIRLAAVESMADMNLPARLPSITTALGDPNSLIRIVALDALGSADSPSAVSSIEPYLFDQEPEVRLAAIEALASLEYEQSIHALAGLLSDLDVRIRHHAVNAIGEIGGEYAITYLLQARYDPDERIRANVVSILNELDS